MENDQFINELNFCPGDGNLHFYLYNWMMPNKLAPKELGMVLVWAWKRKNCSTNFVLKIKIKMLNRISYYIINLKVKIVFKTSYHNPKKSKWLNK